MADATSRQQQFEAILMEALRTHKATNAATVGEVILEYCVPGLSLAVIHEGEIDWFQGYGVLENSQPEPVTTQTLFQAASISKPVTALAVMRLVEAGRLDLDADVNDYLRSWRVPAYDGWQPRITLRQLFTHSAGLSTSGFLGYASGRSLPSLPDILNGAPMTTSEPVRVEGIPGVGFRYSGGGTTIAQLVMMEVTGQDFPALMHEQVLEPLQMHDSAFEHPLFPAKHARAARAHHYSGLPVQGGWFSHPELAAAGLWTTAGDLARFGIAMLQAQAGSHPLISKSIAEQMLTPQFDTPFGGKTGIGFFVEGEGKNQTFGHGGSNVGYSSDLKIAPTQRSGFAMMINSDSGHAFVEQYLYPALSRAYGWETGAEAEAVPEPDSAIIGNYKFKDGTLTVRRNNEALLLNLPGQPAIPLKATKKDTFSVGALKTIVRLKRSEAGEITGLVLEQGGTQAQAERIAEPSPSD